MAENGKGCRDFAGDRSRRLVAKVPREPVLAALQKTTPATIRLKKGTELWRIYFRGGRHPTRWNEFRHVGPVDARFDHHKGAKPSKQTRSVLYAAIDPLTCLAEVFQKQRVLKRSQSDGWLVGFATTGDIELLDLTGRFPTQVGASMGLMTGPRSISRNWARGFYTAYTEVQGIRYPSSMYANAPVIVLNDRAERLGVIPEQPSFHRSLSDPSLITFLRNAAYDLGYLLG